MRRLRIIVLLAFGGFAALLSGGLAPMQAAAQPLVADLSDHLVKITLGFEGSELLLFGAIEGEGEVVVVVYGPPESVTIRRKGKLGGVIWVNQDTATFVNVPAFYQVLSTKALGDWLPDSLRERHQIGASHLTMRTKTATAAGNNEFRTALVRRKQELGHYGRSVGTVDTLSARLFRANVAFPTNVPTGIYTVEVFLVRDGEVVSAQTTPLNIQKIGVLAEIFYFAQAYSAFYGIIAILFAILAGLGANAIFRKV